MVVLVVGGAGVIGVCLRVLRRSRVIFFWFVGERIAGVGGRRGAVDLSLSLCRRGLPSPLCRGVFFFLSCFFMGNVSPAFFLRVRELILAMCTWYIPMFFLL